MCINNEKEDRLKKIEEAWGKSPSRLSSDISVADIKLMLEHFEPLRKLITQIANQNAFSNYYLSDVSTKNNGDQEVIHSIQETSRSEPEIEKAHLKITALNNEIVRLNTLIHLNDQKYKASQFELEKLTTVKDSLESKLMSLEKKFQKVKAQLEQTEDILRSEQEKLKTQEAEPFELTLLRQNTNLAAKFGLVNLPKNSTKALTQAVAILSQQANIEALWEYLKERCEDEHRKANYNEISLLESAINWYNYNRKRHLYQLIKANSGETFNYEKHLRSTLTTSGETIKNPLLPGITSGNGKVLCKPLVTTH